MTVNKFFVLLIFFVCCIAARPSPQYIAELKAAVAKKSYDESFKFKSASTYKPIFWSRRAQMSAVSSMVEATNFADFELLDLLDTNAEFLMAHTSEKLNVKDRVLDKTVPAWITGGYSCGIVYSQVVLSGVTQESIANWVLFAILAKDYCTSAICQQKLKDRVAFLERSIAVYDNLYKKSGDLGWYRWPSNLKAVMGNCDAQDWAAREGSPLPYNMMISMAQTRHVMWRIYGLDSVVADETKRLKHESVVKGIAEYFKKALQYVGATKSYKWLYAPNGRWEDVSHAVGDIRFAVALVEHGPSGIFSKTHLERFANTFKWITENPDKPYSHVVTDYGGPSEVASKRQSLGAWSMLAPWDGAVYNVAAYITYSQEDGDSQRSKALIEKNKPDSGNYVYPRVVRRVIGEVETPWHAIGPSNYALLTRSNDLVLQEWVGKAVSSCIAARFENKIEKLQVRFGHTQILGSKDETANNVGVTGILFSSNSAAKPSTKPSASSWQYVPGSESSKDKETGAFVLSEFTLKEPSYWVAFCRGGAGHSSNNLRVSYFRAIVEQISTTQITPSPATLPPTGTKSEGVAATTMDETPATSENQAVATTTTAAENATPTSVPIDEVVSRRTSVAVDDVASGERVSIHYCLFAACACIKWFQQ